jgi:hypothetical protein
MNVLSGKYIEVFKTWEGWGADGIQCSQKAKIFRIIPK